MTKTTITFTLPDIEFTFKVEAWKSAKGSVHTLIEARDTENPGILAATVEGLVAMLPCELDAAVVAALEAMVVAAETMAA